MFRLNFITVVKVHKILIRVVVLHEITREEVLVGRFEIYCSIYSAVVEILFRKSC